MVRRGRTKAWGVRSGPRRKKWRGRSSWSSPTICRWCCRSCCGRGATYRRRRLAPPRCSWHAHRTDAWRSRAARPPSQPSSGSQTGARPSPSWPSTRGSRCASWSRRCTGSSSSAPCGFPPAARCAGALTPTLQRDEDCRLAVRGAEPAGGVERTQPAQLEHRRGRDGPEILDVADGHVADVDGDPGPAGVKSLLGLAAQLSGRLEPPRPQRLHRVIRRADVRLDRKSTRLNSSHSQISYAVFCLKKKKKENTSDTVKTVQE